MRSPGTTFSRPTGMMRWILREMIAPSDPPSVPPIGCAMSTPATLRSSSRRVRPLEERVARAHLGHGFDAAHGNTLALLQDDLGILAAAQCRARASPAAASGPATYSPFGIASPSNSSTTYTFVVPYPTAIIPSRFAAHDLGQLHNGLCDKPLTLRNGKHQRGLHPRLLSRGRFDSSNSGTATELPAMKIGSLMVAGQFGSSPQLAMRTRFLCGRA